MKKKPARQPRKIEVVEDAPVVTKATKAKVEPKAKSAKAKPAPTDATPAVVEQPAAQPEPNATVAKSGAKKGKTKATTKPAAPPHSDRKPEQLSTVARVEGKLVGKLSAIDAAAKVLEDSAPRNCKELIEAMSAAGLWTSPGGKTPHATLYSAMLREITTKGDESSGVGLRNDSLVGGSTRPGFCWGVFLQRGRFPSKNFPQFSYEIVCAA